MMECGEKVKHAFVVSYAWKNRRKESIPSNNSKYTEEFSEQTAKLIIETGKSATSISE